MKGRVFIFFLFLSFLGSSKTYSQSKPVSINISNAIDRGTVDARIYGLSLEHIYHSCNNGLWGDMVWNRSFEEMLSTQDWRVSDGMLFSPNDGIDKKSQFILGDGSWRNYEVTVKALMENPLGLLKIGIVHTNGASSGARIMHEGYTLVLGAGNNSRFELLLDYFEKKTGTYQQKTIQTVSGKIPANLWNSIRLKSEGRHIQAWLNDSLMIDFKSLTGPLAGWVSLGTERTPAKFKNIKVSALNGSVLFDEVPSPARHWIVQGKGSVKQDSVNALNGAYSLQVHAQNDTIALLQQNFAIHRSEAFSGSLWAKGDAPNGLTIQILDNKKVIAKTQTAALAKNWKEYDFNFRFLSGDIKNVTLKISASGSAQFNIDQISMMPGSAEATGGFRPDLLNAVSALHPNLMRWPGSHFSKDFFWKNSIGPQITRIGKTGWDEEDPLSFGLDEFISFCQKTKAEPIITINLDGNTPDKIKNTLDLLEYCNGDKASKWGKLRSSLGNPNPYKVKYWELGNTDWDLSAEKYADVASAFASAMKQADSSIHIIICGSGGLGKEGIGMDWNKKILETCAPYSDYISLHHYESAKNSKEGPENFERFVAELNLSIQRSANPKLKIYLSEWNAQSTDWRTGLYCAGMLNVLERNNVSMASPSLLLRHTTAPAWDNAFINFNNYTWYAAPNYVMMQLWRNHFGASRMAFSTDTTDLNVSVTKTKNGKRIYVKMVNATSEKKPVCLKLSQAANFTKADFSLVAPGAINARNSFAAPNRIVVQKASIEYSDSTFRFEMPPVSAGIVSIHE